MAPVPITILTGFLGSGKTTLILKLIPQLPKSYRLALLKNEFGDLAVDSQLASASAISGVQELLNGCICCNLVGQLGDALEALREEVKPDRMIIETSGSAFPATLAMEVNRVASETGNYVLDGVINVIDVENWKGYEDTSYTAKLQAKFTDLIVLNKWEHVSERRYEDCLDRIGDLDVGIAQVKSERGRVEKEVVFGLDSKLAASDSSFQPVANAHNHDHGQDHQREVEVLSVTLPASDQGPAPIALNRLEELLNQSTRDEVYRMKAIFWATSVPQTNIAAGVTEAKNEQPRNGLRRVILNWAFGRWTYTDITSDPNVHGDKMGPCIQMTVITARSESVRWKKQLEKSQLIALEKGGSQGLLVERIY